MNPCLLFLILAAFFSIGMPPLWAEKVDLNPVKSLTSTVYYCVDKTDPHKLNLKLVVKNNSQQPIQVDLFLFPKQLILDPQNQDPFDSKGIAPELMEINGLHPVPPVIKAGKEITQLGSIPMTWTFSLLGMPKSFKVITAAAFVDDKGISLDRTAYSFFLTGKLIPATF